jgi:hypothetical protein
MTSTRIEEVRAVPLVCPTRARLTRDYRVTAERTSVAVARGERNLDAASLDEYSAIVETLSAHKQDADVALHALRSHRELHGC